MEDDGDNLLPGGGERSRPLRTLWRWYEGTRGRVAWAMVFYLLKHSPIWLLPIFMERITRSVEMGMEIGLPHLLANTGIMFVIFLQNIPSHMAYQALFSGAKRRMEARLRGRLVRRLQQLSIAYHERMQSGRLQAKVLRDVEAVERMSQNGLDVIAQGIITVVIAMTVTIRNEPLMAAFFAVAIPLGAGLRALFRSKIRQHNRELRSGIEEMSGRVGEMIEMIPIARAHAVEHSDIRKVDEHLEQVRQRGYRLDMLNGLFGCASWVTFSVVRLACLSTSTYLAMRYPQRMTLPDVIMYQGLFEIILRSVSSVVNMYPMMATGIESIHSIAEVLDCPDIEHNEGKRPLDYVDGALRFENVSFRYPDGAEEVIRDFSLDVPAGESVAVVGESGAGKSTLMGLVMGFHRPTRGRILLDGQDMAELDLRTFRRHLAVVPQETILFSGSVRDNISHGLDDVGDERLWAALELANAAEFVARLDGGLDGLITEGGKSLSGGQRQRLAIGRAMIRDPRVIIFDEATSSLDVASEALVQEAIERLIENRTTFIVAHRLSTIRKCGHIVVMKDGQAVETGSHAELLDLQGEFHRLRAMQV